MTKKITFLFSIILLVIITNLNGQNLLTIGEWQDHLNYRQAKSVTQSPESIIISTGSSLIILDKATLSFQKFNKIDGLSQTAISDVKYDKFNEQLFVLYADGSFDIVKDDKIIYIDAIRENKLVRGDKKISDIHIADANTVYLAMPFGVVEFDSKKLEFKSTTFSNLFVSAVTTDSTYIYAAMTDGLYRIEKKSRIKEAFSQWQFLGANFGLPALYKATNIEIFDNKIYTVIDGQLYIKNTDNQFKIVDLNKSNKFDIEWLSAEGKHLIVGLRDDLFASYTKFMDKNGKIVDGGADCINRTRYGIEEENGRIWYADDWRMIRYTEGINTGCKKLEYDSPYSSEVNQIEVGKSQILFSGVGAKENFQLSLNGRLGFYSVEKKSGKWTNFNEEYTPDIGKKGFLHFNTVAPHPTKDSVFYAGSYFSGLMEVNSKTNQLKYWSETPSEGVLKSSLQSILGAPGQVRIAHMKFDNQGNLWMSNTGSPKPICVFTKDGDWFSYNVPGNGNLSKMTIDANGNKWFATFGAGGAVVVFNDNKTPADPSDDKIKVLTQSNSLIKDPINVVESDLDGDVWVGTTEGVITFDCDPFKDNCTGNRRKLELDGNFAELLDAEEVFAIEVDGANRKWFGTRNGIFVISADGNSQIAKYNISNSPLFSNKIIDLDFDPETGFMYIASNDGLQSFKTDAKGGVKTQVEDNVFVYPNPVRPNYTGPIAIKGLARDADVRITDVNGRLVFTTKANGGQAIWDGNSYSGGRVDSGVYLVFSTNENNLANKDVVVSKITIIK
jgi:hypothetical protein